ncbi:hypothetical protein D3C84_979340 [compost metagenome]
MATDILGAEALVGVVAECALELGQRQIGAGDLQVRVGGTEIHHHVGRMALLQRDIQLQPAVKSALSLPASENVRSAHRGFLKNLQAVGEAAVQLGVQ